MSNYVRNLKSAMHKMKRDQSLAGNQLIFKEKEALVLTGAILFIPICALVFSVIVKN
ncbi:hypothetical protein [Anaeromicrobium sediminis]|uniref:hypothetical protein n=1 Tax=Anaeromicrobium sediminis TaxID=1478221 RepID=UPI00159604E8|nr:hypothetical protein [Anaeromicrobium sediminis]